ncbi:transcriptional repressor [Micromonospora tulbaghiae]|uniref:Transcriptional repressor n=1 Tax=Micromonospora tulbaghiae TaxID=479978 RepID=A0A386WNQ7_9ACTN|nr:Fur family transcriptional regulator [Micromonospora tulbaghiae]AYF30016.1 transcriptional repressor [Micromonospora tulbaghiae]
MTASAGNDVVAKVAAALRNNGDRMTASRRAVIEVLVHEPGHISAEQVAAAAAHVHRSSVYRALETLTELGFVQHVHLGHGSTAYHLINHTGPHLHAQCRSCGTIYDLPGPLLDAVARRLDRDLGFRLEAHHVALSGTCSACTTTT